MDIIPAIAVRDLPMIDTTRAVAQPACHEPSVPARVLGWEDDGRARVALLAPAHDRQIGSVLVVGPRPDAKGRRPIDFAGLNKQGLRIGGIVLLRRLKLSSEGSTARAIEALIMRESTGAPFVVQRCAACILPPPDGTAVVGEALIAMLENDIAVRTLSEGVVRLPDVLDQPSVFGFPGVLFHGYARNGEPMETMVGADRRTSVSELVARVLREVPKETIKESRTSGTNREQWRMTPLFRIPIDPDRSSKLSAQAANFAYGSFDAPRWTLGGAVLRSAGDTWLLADASPCEEVGVVPARIQEVDTAA